MPELKVRPPESSRSERILALVIFVVAFLYLCLFRRATWVDLDEGIILQGAQRILDGQVLYRDFFSFFTPGSYYLLALVFRIFGDSYLVAHTLVAFVGACFSPLTYLLARRVCGRQASLLVTALMTATAVPMRFIVLHNWDSTLWACLALYCAVRLLETSSARWAFAAASFSALTTLFEQSKGAGLLLGLGLGFLLIALNRQQPNVFSRRFLVPIALGLAWPFAITFIYFASHHAFTDMLQSWLWPLSHYSTANRVPYGFGNLPKETEYKILHEGSLARQVIVRLVFSPRDWIPYLPLLGLALLFRLAIPKWRRIPLGPDWSYYVLVSAVITGLLPAVVAVRADYLHFIFLQPIFFLILAWILDGKSIRSPLFIRLAPAAGFCLCASLFAMGAQAVAFQTLPEGKVSSRRGTLFMGNKDMVIDFIQSHVATGGNVLIYPYQPSYYYLTGTYTPTRFEFNQPGMHSPDQVQEMVTEFSAQPTKFVLYEPAFPDHIHDAWPNTPAAALASDPMADYIAKKYRACGILTSANNWHFLIMVQKDLSCPDSQQAAR